MTSRRLLLMSIALVFLGMPIRIESTGQMTSADEIKMTRKVLDIATESLVAKRVKQMWNLAATTVRVL